MSALELAGLLPEMAELTPTLVERWIAASLAQAAALREHDRWLYPSDPARHAAAERLHAAWRQWAVDGETLLRRAESLVSQGKPVRGLDELRDNLGRALAMLQLSPSVATERRKKANAGDVYTIEEVRRELRLPDRG